MGAMWIYGLQPTFFVWFYTNYCSVGRSKLKYASPFGPNAHGPGLDIYAKRPKAVRT